MRHDNLDAEKIRSLVKASEGTSERNDLLSNLIEAIGLIVVKRFALNRKLPGKTLELLFKHCDSVIRDRFRPLDYQHDRKPSTRTHPKGEQLESCYSMLVHLSGRENGFYDLYQLVSVRLFATRKFFRIDVIAHPAAFQYHAAERLMERTMGVEDALDVLGRNLSKWIPFISEAELRLPTDGGCCVPVEYNAGMLVGEFTNKLAVGAMRYDFNKNGVDTTPLRMNPGHMRAFVARTFVSRHQLRPAQAYAMKLLTNWDQQNEIDRHENEINMLWPWSFNNDNGAEVGGLGRHALEELDLVMEDPVFVRSMHAATEHSRSQPSDDLLDLGDWGSVGAERDRTVGFDL